ncbi:Lipopolysaccharide-induced tumor necrosis factor-alpha factor [Clonorchis sinensis]|uniref:Lipopolysaccharide-induced tumor necrosis factor-alpha factor n=1 Tax=Clonorchis sinensis TaxID=79923 RepID=A0A8T1M4T7_CLOSI|nr:Lipopolysaccharide-induced tumor necrosis factor-alpha factor [Clonorchis sinensis]
MSEAETLACGKIKRSDSVTATVKTDEKKQNKRPTKSELRRYSIQCLTEHESSFKTPIPILPSANRSSGPSGKSSLSKIPENVTPRPSLYGYPLIGTRPSITEPEVPSEESKEVTPQMKAIRKEEPVKLTRESVAFRCDTCQQSSMTITTYHVGTGTWLMAVLIFLLGGVLGCFLIPFYTNCCKDVKHTCPVCDTEVGVVKAI